MPIQFAQHSDLPLPALFTRSSMPSSDRNRSLQTCADTISARQAAVVSLRRENPPSIPDAAILPTPISADAALRPFLEAISEAEAQKHLQTLLQRQAAPIIARIIRRKWHVMPNRAHGPVQRREEWEAEDMYQDTLTLLLVRLHACREDRSQPVIRRFAAYVAMTTARVCAERLRSACPERDVCRQKLRYILKTHPELATWRDDWNRTVCGLKAWQGRNASQAALLRLQTWEAQRSPADTADAFVTGSGIAGLLAWLGGPVPQARLVGTLAAALPPTEPADRRAGAASQWQAGEEASDPVASLKDTRVEVASDVEQRAFLRWLWTEILALPLRQRSALLLNLRDAQNRGVLALLVHAHIATRTEIAQALGMSAGELMGLLPDLPLEDNVVAELLSCTQQQVSNLRKAARARLARRTGRYEEGEIRAMGQCC